MALYRAQLKRDTDNNLRTGDATLLTGEPVFATDAQYIKTHNSADSFNSLGIIKADLLANVSANTTYTAADPENYILVTAGSGTDISIVLPDAATVTARTYFIQKVDTGTANVDITATGGDTFNGGTLIPLTEQHQFVQVISDGTNYIILDRSKDLMSLHVNADISASDTDIDITDLEDYPIDWPFRIAAYDGDGSNDLSFTSVTTETINNIAADEYNIEGTGNLDLVRTASGTFETRNSGEIWDSDGGNYNSGNLIYYKNIDGRMFVEDLYTQSAYPTLQNIGISFAATPYQNQRGVGVSSPSIQHVFLNITASASTFNAFVFLTGTGNITSGTFRFPLYGRWTTAYPKKS